jgi:hypothetical protein
LTVGSGGPFPGQGRFQLERYLRARGDVSVRTVRDLVDKARFFEDERYDMQRAGLEERLADDVMDGSVRVPSRHYSPRGSLFWGRECLYRGGSSIGTVII